VLLAPLARANARKEIPKVTAPQGNPRELTPDWGRSPARAFRDDARTSYPRAVTHREEDVRAYVCRVIAECSADGILSVNRLVPGENSAVYRVTYQDPRGDVNEALVRLGPRGVAGRLRAEREARVLEKVGGLAGPKLYDFSPDVPGFDRPVMCLEFLSGAQPDLAGVGREDLERLGRLVQWLHAQPVDDLRDWAPSGIGLSGYVQERWREHLASRLGAIRDPLPSRLQERLNAAVAAVAGSVEELEGLSSVGGDRLVLLHADISGANLLWVPEPLLIDWEYARLGDPADEVAYLFTQNALLEPQQEAFWRGYSEGLTDVQVGSIAQRVRHWEPITLLGSVLWWLDAWSRAEAANVTGRSDPVPARERNYYLEQAVARLDRF
jgi:aminoglycoside phosphotransferase (APT) family kinase protein